MQHLKFKPILQRLLDMLQSVVILHTFPRSQKVKKVIKKIKTSHKLNPTVSSVISVAVAYFPWVFQSRRNKRVSLGNSTRYYILLVSNAEYISIHPFPDTIRDAGSDQPLALWKGTHPLRVKDPHFLPSSYVKYKLLMLSNMITCLWFCLVLLATVVLFFF